MMTHPDAVGTDINGCSHFRPELYALGLGLAVIVSRSFWSIARILREHWPDIELPATNASAEES